MKLKSSPEYLKNQRPRSLTGWRQQGRDVAMRRGNGSDGGEAGGCEASAVAVAQSYRAAAALGREQRWSSTGEILELHWAGLELG